MLTDDYRVRIDAFEGPLDLLLYLIRKHEVDIHDIPVAAITEQYMRFLEGIERIDIDVAGEFLVTAATLMEIKSRMLVPQAEGAAPAEDDGDREPREDPRAELVRQLLAYKKYRDAATALEARADEWRQRYPAGHAAADKAAIEEALEAAAADVEIEDLELIDLVEAFRVVTETINFERLGEHQVTYDDTPIELHAEDIVDRLKREASGGGEGASSRTGELPFINLFTGRTRAEMVGLFLALLELCRRRAVAFRHDESGAIQLRLRTEEEIAQDKAMVGGDIAPAAGETKTED